MDEDMVTVHTRKQLSWSMHTHMDEPNFDVYKESCVLRRLKKPPQARHMTVKPTIMLDEQVSNALVKVSAEVARRNMDKAATIKALCEELKTKDS